MTRKIRRQAYLKGNLRNEKCQTDNLRLLPAVNLFKIKFVILDNTKTFHNAVFSLQHSIKSRFQQIFDLRQPQVDQCIIARHILSQRVNFR